MYNWWWKTVGQWLLVENNGGEFRVDYRIIDGFEIGSLITGQPRVDSGPDWEFFGDQRMVRSGRFPTMPRTDWLTITVDFAQSMLLLMAAKNVDDGYVDW